ncbi:hypothetical protein [Microbacterium sp. MYb66]|uniref:hypothetical protein n=1 Tax=Microbacterium sp. MYb66 TaxID=1848692 RepID=UPI000CFE99E8|nr:hypothetical protein [Microbacterium sp. MYb66]PRA79193.1 hypothetical protein CQ045_15565 [Microbacterium sp. MYb66]
MDEEWTDKDTAAVEAESLPFSHPVRATQAFIGALLSDDPESDEALRTLVTPESEGAWGDFASAREFARRDLRISLVPRRDEDAPDVAYVKFAPDEGAWIHRGVTDDNVAAWATLIWRPEISAWGPIACWRVHQIGPYVHPIDLPRTAPGFDPNTM